MNFLRFVVAVEEQWLVTVTQDTVAIGSPRQMERGAGGKRAWPQAPGDDQPALKAAGRNLAPKELEEMLGRITRRRPRENEVATLGMHLFDALLGEALWDAIQTAAVAANAPNIELALRFPGGHELARLQWEMLHDGAVFLAEGKLEGNRLRRVAITRMVSGSEATPRKMNLPPRALFIVGCEVDDERIRPGAEFLGLLRQMRLGAYPRTFHPRILVKATVQRIKQEMQSFKPDIVHFICHGNNKGELQFAPEEGEPQGDSLSAQQVWDLFQNEAGEIWRPTVVVLGACYTAQPDPTDKDQSPKQELLTTEQSAPLAALLVEKGVPIVVGMAGRVADQACRLFTRSFGEALLTGRPLVEATEIGRRAAFQKDKFANTSSDWALPTLFLPENGVGPDFAATKRDPEPHEKRIDSLVISFRDGRGREPFFAARVEKLAEAYAGLSSGRNGLLALLGDLGFGCTRLLQELVELAVRDGHLPVLLSAYYRGWSAPTDLATLIATLAAELVNTRDVYLVTAPKFQIQHLEKLTEKKDVVAQLHEDVADELTGGKPTVTAVVYALRHDLEVLLEAARQVPGSPISPTGRPILFIDDLEQLGPDVLGELFTGKKKLLGENGLGHPGRPEAAIPLVVAFSSDQTWQTLKEATLGKYDTGWVAKIYLERLKVEFNEDLAAYRQVLLNPHIERLPDVSGKRWVIPDDKNPDKAKKWFALLRKRMNAIPADFKSEKLYEWVENAEAGDFVFEADDDDVLKSLNQA